MYRPIFLSVGNGLSTCTAVLLRDEYLVHFNNLFNY